MSRPIIFLNPSVLMHVWDRTCNRYDDPTCFEQEALNRLNQLISRVGNAAIVLTFPDKDTINPPSLEELKNIYRDCGLGERIIGKIDDPTPFWLNDGKLVDDWLQNNHNSPNPFPIHSFVILSRSIIALHSNRSVRVEALFSEENMILAEDILTNKPLEPNEIPAKDIHPVRISSLDIATDSDCVIS